MDEHDQSGPVPPSGVEEVAVESSGFESRPFSHWVKRFLVCNPFYLVSAALLIFGIYKVSGDVTLFARETTQLAFNFSSLQIYELLLVGTAVFLAMRKVWYDSTLLVGLENLLLLVPFFLISQAALIDRSTVGQLSGVAALMVLVRFGFLKSFFGELNLPKRSLLIGVVLLAVNVALVTVFRHLQETRSQDWGPAYVMHEWVWLVILPAVFAAGNFLPNAKEVGSLLPQRRWLPAGFFALWAVGTAVHVYGLSYVYDFSLRRELIVPSLWVLAWTISWRIADLGLVPGLGLKRALLTAPLLAALFSAQSGNKVFVGLMLLNGLIYAGYWIVKADSRFVRHLLFASVVMIVAGLPVETLRWAGPHFDRGNYLAAAVAVYLVLCTIVIRDPRMGFLGGLVSGIATLAAMTRHPMAIHWAFQAALVFVLLHSLRWDDAAHAGSSLARRIVAVLWMLHAFVWAHGGADWWMSAAPAGLLLAGYVVFRVFRGRWELLILPESAVLVGLSVPGNLLVGVIRDAPSGLLAIAGSFLLFAAGTAVALTKHRWHPGVAKR
jgi:hypothetical protein